jgi:hypothetical protein
MLPLPRIDAHNVCQVRETIPNRGVLQESKGELPLPLISDQGVIVSNTFPSSSKRTSHRKWEKKTSLAALKAVQEDTCCRKCCTQQFTLNEINHARTFFHSMTELRSSQWLHDYLSGCTHDSEVHYHINGKVLYIQYCMFLSILYSLNDL